MADTQPTSSIPTNVQQAPQTPRQETDFFGGGEEAFKNGAVVSPNTDPTPFVPEENVWEPTIPEEPKAVEGWKVESWEVKIEPIPEPVVESIPEPVVEPVIEPIETISEPIAEVEKKEKEQEEEKEEINEPVTVQEKEPVVQPTGLSDLCKKFMELEQLCKQIQERKKTDEGFSIVWADNDKLHILYTFLLGDPEFPMVTVTKTETDKTDEEDVIHELNFYLNEEGNSLNVNLDEELLFEEEVDLVDDVNKKMQVMDKLNKFIFLVSEESKKLEKEIKVKQAEQEEKRKLQDVFRNF